MSLHETKSPERRTSSNTYSPSYFRGVVSLDYNNESTPRTADGHGGLMSMSPLPLGDSRGANEDGNIAEYAAGASTHDDTPLRSNSTRTGPLEATFAGQHAVETGGPAASTSSTTAVSSTQRQPHHSNKSSTVENNTSLRKRGRRRKYSKDYSTKSSKSRRRRKSKKHQSDLVQIPSFCPKICCGLCRDRTFVRSTLSCMNLMAKILFWCSAVASVAAVIWYSYELKRHGTDPHLIAWFSAGAFVLLGFPISMYGIVMQLANYNQPHVQMYVVRILWMVPLYSIESWLCLRYKDYAIYIETLRDCYESYVLYSFLQFLIEVLGGEDALILMLKDKSPTRGVHMWGLQWCVKPWLMGQPLRKTYESFQANNTIAASGTSNANGDSGYSNNNKNAGSSVSSGISGNGSGVGAGATTLAHPLASSPRPLKRVHWTSPFFVKCKFGVLQYVLLKFICSIVVMILERNKIYKEGDFTPRGGYLYICILTNLSQCWALYCLIFFYYATKNELSSIRPVGKFLSVKALVFFTWWQSVMISIFYQMDLIPHYQEGRIFMGTAWGSSSPMEDDDTALVEAIANSNSTTIFTMAPGTAASSLQQEWSAEDVAKGMQDYLICIEMFIAAMVHIFVFPHTEYTPQAVEARTRALNQTPHKHWNKRLGRKWKEWDNKSGWSGTTNTSGDDIELSVFPGGLRSTGSSHSYDEDDDLRIHPLDRLHENKTYGDSSSAPAATFHDDYGDHDDNYEDAEDAWQKRERKPLLGSVASIGESGAMDVPEEGFDEYESSMGSIESSELHDGESYQDFDDDDFDDDDSADQEYEGVDLEGGTGAAHLPTPLASGSANAQTPTKPHKPGFVKALLDSAIPQDLRDNTVGIIKGDYVVERKTLLHHAATSDSYDLFSRVGNRLKRPQSSLPKNKK